MKIRVVSTCFNEREMLPYYLRHYSAFADEIIVYDHESSDGSSAIINQCDKAVVASWPYGPGLDDEAMIALWQMALQEAKKDGIDWVMFPDIDEFIWCRDIRWELKEAESMGRKIITAQGWNMVWDGVPKDDGRQIWERCRLGIQEPIYSKPIVLKPDVDVNWKPGRHDLVDGNKMSFETSKIKLLHYRFLGPDYTYSRTAKNHSRIALARKTTWDGRMDMVAFGSPEYARQITGMAVNVFANE